MKKCVEFLFLDGWLSDLETILREKNRRVRYGHRGAMRFEKATRIECVDIGRHTYVLIAEEPSYAVRHGTGIIYKVTTDGITKTNYGRLSDWWQWDWTQEEPVKKE